MKGENKEKKAVVMLVALLCGIGIFFFQIRYVSGYLFRALAWGGTAFFLTWLAWVDYCRLQFPNELVLLLFIFLLGCLILDTAGVGSQIGMVLKPNELFGISWSERLLGTLLPILLFALLSLIRPGSVGGGDEKLFFMLGFFFGFEAELRIMFLTFLFAAVMVLVLTQKKKVNRRTLLPLGPSLWAAFLVTGCMSL